MKKTLKMSDVDSIAQIFKARTTIRRTWDEIDELEVNSAVKIDGAHELKLKLYWLYHETNEALHIIGT